MPRKIITEAMELSEENLNDDFNFFSGGMDSLQEFIVLDQINEELKLHLKGGEFTRYPNVREMRNFLESLQPSQKNTTRETEDAIHTRTEKSLGWKWDHTQVSPFIPRSTVVIPGLWWSRLWQDLYLDCNESLEAYSLVNLGMDSIYLAQFASIIMEVDGLEIGYCGGDVFVSHFAWITGVIIDEYYTPILI